MGGSILSPFFAHLFFSAAHSRGVQLAFGRGQHFRGASDGSHSIAHVVHGGCGARKSEGKVPDQGAKAKTTMNLRRPKKDHIFSINPSAILPMTHFMFNGLLQALVSTHCSFGPVSNPLPRGWMLHHPVSASLGKGSSRTRHPLAAEKSVLDNIVDVLGKNVSHQALGQQSIFS